LYVAAERKRGVTAAAAQLELIEQVDHLRLDEEVQHSAAAKTEAVVVKRREIGALLPFETEGIAIGEEVLGVRAVRRIQIAGVADVRPRIDAVDERAVLIRRAVRHATLERLQQAERQAGDPWRCHVQPQPRAMTLIDRQIA